MLVGAGVPLGQVVGAAEVVPGGEDRTVAGQDYHAHVVVRLGPQKGRGEFDEQAPVLGVAVLHAVEHDAGDGAFVVGFVTKVLVFGDGTGVGGHEDSFRGRSDGVRRA